jgi:hypothetical protein
MGVNPLSTRMVYHKSRYCAGHRTKNVGFTMRLLFEARLLTVFLMTSTPTGLLLPALVICALMASAGLARQQMAQAAPTLLAQLPFHSMAPDILTRQEWHAELPLFAMKPQQVTGIILHHTGLRHTSGISLEDRLHILQHSSQKPRSLGPRRVGPPLADSPYHYYIDMTGRIGEARDPAFAGDTNTHYDPMGYLQVVMEGNFQTIPVTRRQFAAMRDLLAWLMLVYDLTPGQVTVHKQHAATACPGRHFMAILPQLMQESARQWQSMLSELCNNTR